MTTTYNGPTITGTHTSTTINNAPLLPFTGVTIADAGNGTDGLTITLPNGGTTGTLTGNSTSESTFINEGNGIYFLGGFPAFITSELDALVFTPAEEAPGITTTGFNLSDTSSIAPWITITDTTTVVTDTNFGGDPPRITGTHSSTTILDAPVQPFSGVEVIDQNFGATDTLTITSLDKLYGTLSGTGLTGSGGVYTLARTTAATITSELDALTFTPTTGLPNSVTTTTFTLSDQSTAYLTPIANSATTVTDTDRPPFPPTITGTFANQQTTNDTPINPFNWVTVGDANTGASDTLTITTNAGGVLSGTGLNANGGGIYTLSGTATTITTELDALSFAPAHGARTCQSMNTPYQREL